MIYDGFTADRPVEQNVGAPFAAWRAVPVLAVCCAIPLATHAYLGTFARYMADDYCTSYSASQYGIVGSMLVFYRSWTGRFSLILLDGAVGSLDAHAVRWTPGLALIAWVTTVAAFLRAILPTGIPASLRNGLALFGS